MLCAWDSFGKQRGAAIMMFGCRENSLGCVQKNSAFCLLLHKQQQAVPEGHTEQQGNR